MEDIFELILKINDQLNCIHCLQSFNLIATRVQCDCGRIMHLIKRNDKNDGYMFRCPIKCKQLSVRQNSFFSKSKLPLKKLVLFTYFWLQDIPINMIGVMVGVTSKTLADWNSFLCEMCSTALLSLCNEEKMIGGENCIVEIETLISKKPKYFCGRWYQEIWLIGGIERVSGKWFGQVILRRDRESLVSIIKEFIQPRTTIYSDQCPGYYSSNWNLEDVEDYHYTHKTVNHSVCFKIPNTDIYTNTIKGLWGNIKNDEKKRGLKFEQNVNYIDFRMWLSRQGNDNENLLETFWSLIALNYQV